MGFLKKIFGGKNNGEKSADGTKIYSYENEEMEADLTVAPQRYVETVTEHMSKAFPGREENVFHELVSEIIHIDVNVMAPTREDPFWVLYTTGMSDLPMTLDSEIPKDVADRYQFGEVMLFLPEEWDLSQEAMQDENNYWPIRLMKQMARFPHQYHTWLGYYGDETINGPGCIW